MLYKYKLMKNFKQLLAFNSSRSRLWSENSEFAEQVPPGALVLDAGAGSAPYKSLYQHAQYESADFEQVDIKYYATSTYVCDLKSIPVENCRFDFVVFNQVMEHLPEPELVLNELNRVMKTGGKMIYSGPLFFEEHEQPYDFYRYTQFGLQHLFSQAGFEIERLDWLEGYFGTVAYQFNCMARYLPVRPSLLGSGFIGYSLVPVMLLLKIVFAGCSILFHKLEMHTKYKQRGFPKNYIAIIRKS